MFEIFNKNLINLREERAKNGRNNHSLYLFAMEEVEKMVEDVKLLHNKTDCTTHYEIFTLHKQNQPLTVCKCVYNNLAKGDIFAGTFFAPDNCKEMQDLFLQHQGDKFYPRFLPSIDIKISGMLLQNAGFTGIVVDLVQQKRHYKNAIEFMKGL